MFQGYIAPTIYRYNDISLQRYIVERVLHHHRHISQMLYIAPVPDLSQNQGYIIAINRLKEISFGDRCMPFISRSSEIAPPLCLMCYKQFASMVSLPQQR